MVEKAMQKNTAFRRVKYLTLMQIGDGVRDLRTGSKAKLAAKLSLKTLLAVLMMAVFVAVFWLMKSFFQLSPSRNMLITLLFVTQIVAFPCAILFGKLSAKFSCSKLLIVCISSYLAIGIFIVFLCQEWQFWLLAVAIGGFQGAVQALSRSYFTKIIPAEKSGEYFGIYDIFGKSAAILGLGLTSLLGIFYPLSEATWINISLLHLPVLFAIGLVLFLVAMKVPAVKHDPVQESDEE
jgi:MFS-type transporter involved in bile tolerance (Atg22 family)